MEWLSSLSTDGGKNAKDPDPADESDRLQWVAVDQVMNNELCCGYLTEIVVCHDLLWLVWLSWERNGINDLNQSVSQSVSQSSGQTLQKPKSGFYNSWRVVAAKAANFAGRPATQWHCVEIYNWEDIVWKSTIEKKYDLAEFAVRRKKPLAGQLWQNLAAVLGLELINNHSLTELFSEWIRLTDWLLVAVVSQLFDLTAVAALNWTGAKPRQPPCQLKHMSIKLRTCS